MILRFTDQLKVDVHVKQLPDGTHELSYFIVEAGMYELSICVDGKLVGASPYTLSFTDPPSPPQIGKGMKGFA